jgi:hypothetical protein
MYEQKIAFWMYLAAVPLWGTPIYIVVWTAVRLSAARWRSALVGFFAGTAAWLAATVFFFVTDFMIQPCLENCSSRYRAPWQDVASFAAMLVYTALGVLIVVMLHRSRRLRDTGRERPDTDGGGAWSENARRNLD